MFDFDEIARNGANVVLGAHSAMSATAQAMGREHEMVTGAQLSTADDLRKLRERYEADLKEQVKENRVNRWLTVASLLIAAVSMIVSIVK